MRGPGLSHLVLVEPDLRQPLVVDRARDGLRLLLREHEPVAVVVVADVVVVEPRHAPALVARAEVLPVPLGLHHLPVGVDRRQQQQHHLVEAALRLGVLGGRERVRPLHRHLRGADLGRVDVAGDEQEHLALAHERLGLGLGEAARVGDLARDLLQPLLVREVLLGGDRGQEQVLAERRLAEHLELDARRGGVERLEVGEDLPVVGERPVGAHGHAEELGGGLDGLGVRGGDGKARTRRAATRERSFMKTSEACL